MSLDTEVMYVVAFPPVNGNAGHGYLRPLRIPPNIAGDRTREREFLLADQDLPRHVVDACVRIVYTRSKPNGPFIDVVVSAFADVDAGIGRETLIKK